MPNEELIEITKEDLVTIHGGDYSLFQKKIIPNCFCGKCDTPYTSTIVDYVIFLNDLNDVVLRGFCAKCGSKMNRYVETGEVKEYKEAIGKIRERYSKN